MTEDIPIKTLAIAQSPRRVPTGVVACGLGLLGILVFAILASSRAATAQEGGELPGLVGTPVSSASPMQQPVAAQLALQPAPVTAIGTPAVAQTTAARPNPFIAPNAILAATPIRPRRFRPRGGSRSRYGRGNSRARIISGWSPRGSLFTLSSRWCRCSVRRC